MDDKKTYNPNMSPAAKRRHVRGKRSVEEFENFEYRPDMTEYEMLEAWEWENTRDWTRRLPSVQEREEAMEQRRLELERNKSRQGINRQAVNRQGRNCSSGRAQQASRASRETEGNVRKDTARNNKIRKIKWVSKSILINLYSLSVIGLLLTFMIVNVLPWIFFWPMAIGTLGLNLFIRKSYQFGFRRKTKFWATCLTLIHAIVIYYLYLVFGLLVSLSGNNMGNLMFWNDTFHVYISGNDTFGSLKVGTRSDVNLIATVNSGTGQMMITTTPRDYYVVIPGVSGGQKDKLTHAGNYGPEASMSTLSNLYDEDINQYVRVNFSSVIGIIDALGGVTVESEVEFLADHSIKDGKEIVVGKNDLTGEQALAFVRERYDFSDGDAQRARNQQALIIGIMRELISPSIIFKSDAVFDSIAENIDTNMTVTQMQRAIKSVLKGVVYTTIQNVEAKGTDGREYCYSYSAGSLYVSIPIQDSIDEITTMMDELRGGKKYYLWSEKEND